MFRIPQGIPNLPDLTHPDELIAFGSQLLSNFLILALLIAVLGIVFAGVSLALRRDQLSGRWIDLWLERYDLMLRVLQHGTVVLLFLVVGFFLCSTLANRYHHWEQARVIQVASGVAGDRLQQQAPRVRYVIQVPYTNRRYVDRKWVEVKETRDVSRYLTLSGSQIKVVLDQVPDPTTDDRLIYLADFTADYQVRNPLGQTEDFFFEISPPYSYSLLQNFRVERDGIRLLPVNPGDYGFPFRLQPGEQANFRVTYQAQGSSRWVYNANGQLLSNFRLSAIANFPQADFASGILPTETVTEGTSTRFTWVFQDNVSVRNPFGVFTATNTVRDTGILPRLLILTPALFLWWLLLLYFSVPMAIPDVAIAAGIFFACILALTYSSRVMNAPLAWSSISLILLWLAWGLGSANRPHRHASASWAAIVPTIAGAVLPVFALLIPYSGLTLSLAALLSVLWLAVRHWHRWYITDS